MKYFKTLLFFLAGILLCACNANEDEKVLNSEECFSEADIIKLKAAKKLVKETSDEIAIPMQQAIRHSRATTGDEMLTDEETTVIRARLKMAGVQTVATFNDFGISSAELNGILPIEGNEELYGAIGINIFNGLEPIDYNGAQLVKFDVDKAIGCLAAAFGITPASISTIALATFAGEGAAKVIGKEQLKKLITTVVSQVAKALGKKVLQVAAGGLGTAYIVLEWTWCYYDLPTWS